MKALLALTIVLSITVPAAIAGDNQAKADTSCCEKAKAAECLKVKDSCCAKQAAALRQALLTHKGAYIVQR